VVYRARDTRLDREVALKLLPADSTSGETGASAIIEEGRLLAQVRHPNVVTIHGAEQIGGQIGLSMELVNGWTLEQVLEQGKRFEAPEVVEIGIQLCGAIAAVHKAGLLHRDIKTQNVMRADDGRLVLMDFGTGREVGDGSTGGLAGTPLYLAPELLSGYEPTIRSDIYSLGVLLYHLLTGSYPVRADRLSDLRRAHERGERTDLRTARPAVRSKLARIIDRAIDPAPERRYQTVDALREDLQAQQPPSTNVRALSVLAAAAAILLIASVGWEMGGRRAGWHSTPTTLVAEIVGLTRGSATDDAIGSPVIAVLPFEDLSPRRENDELADGLTDEIIRSLASVQGLQVRARASSFAFKGKPHDLREVGQQLGANLVVEGSIQRSGDTLRIDARLVQVAGSVPLWAETFDRTVKGILTVEAEIAQAIVTRLRLTLGAGQRRYDFDVDTYILYLKARARLGRRGGDDAKAASALFQQVVQRDPAFAPAYAGLADAYGLMSHPTLLPGVVEAAIPLMQQAADKALELDPLLAEGHAALGFVFARQKSWDKAHSSFQRAIDLNPALTQTYINYFTTTLLPHERFDDAERVLQAAARTDPLSGTVHGELGYLKLAAGRFDEAIEHYTRARALDPNLPYINQHLGRAMTFAGRFSEALSFWETKMDPSGTVAYKESPGGQVWMAVAYVMAGRRTEVERWAEVHDEPYRLALIHAALGNKDRTFEALNRAADIVPHRVVPLLSYPEMRLLRGDPRLAALRQRLQLP
jgi:serine/threonine-protein kinase